MRLAVLFALAACSAEAAPVKTAIAVDGDIVDRVLLTGALHATDAIELAVPRTDEPSLAIRWFAPDVSAVKAGDPIAELDRTPFTTRLAEGRTQLASAETQFRTASASAAATLADKRKTVRQREIDAEKAKLHADVPVELVTARAAQEAKAALDRAEIELEKARQDVTTTEAALALESTIKQVELERTRHAIADAEQAIAALVIRAPRDGLVVIAERSDDNRKFRVGDTVYPNTVIASLPDLGKPMQVRAALIDVDDGRIAVGMTGTCTLDAHPEAPIACTAVSIAPVARATSGSYSLRRAFDVTLSLARIDPARVRPGMSVKVELPRRLAHGVVVPRSAVLGGAWLRLGSGELRRVELGACDTERCAVTSGVAAGEAVAL